MAMEKVSVTLPAELVAQARALAGAGGLSRFVAESLERNLRRAKLQEAIEEWEREYGPIEPEILEEMKQWLPSS
ncbi:MAG TPA: hypothetical protein VK009_07085 [Chloroflexota bacterium]|nr:hypothetical protein [Chloroflexota bacterium]